jgi:hypothetical protein
MELRLKLATSAAFVSALVSNRILMPIFDRGQGSNYASSRKNELRHLVGLAPKKRASLVAYVDGCTHCELLRNSDRAHCKGLESSG